MDNFQNFFRMVQNFILNIQIFNTLITEDKQIKFSLNRIKFY